MKRLGILLVTASALFLTACGDDPPVADKAAIEKSIRDAEAAMLKAMTARDTTALAATYAADAVVMTPFSPPMKGAAAINEGMKALFSDPAFQLNFTADRIETSASGDLAAARGTYKLVVTDPATHKPINDHGSFVTVYRKQADATWKAVLDINSSEVAPTPPPAPKAAAKKATARKAKKR